MFACKIWNLVRTSCLVIVGGNGDLNEGSPRWNCRVKLGNIWSWEVSWSALGWAKFGGEWMKGEVVKTWSSFPLGGSKRFLAVSVARVAYCWTEEWLALGAIIFQRIGWEIVSFRVGWNYSDYGDLCLDRMRSGFYPKRFSWIEKCWIMEIVGIRSWFPHMELMW